MHTYRKTWILAILLTVLAMPAAKAQQGFVKREDLFQKGSRLLAEGHSQIAFLHPERLFCMAAQAQDEIPVHYLKVDGCVSTVNQAAKGLKDLPRSCGEMLFVRNLKKNGSGYYDLGLYAYLIDTPKSCSTTPKSAWHFCKWGLLKSQDIILTSKGASPSSNLPWSFPPS